MSSETDPAPVPETLTLPDGTQARPAVKCRRPGCTQWLIAPSSVRNRIGPVCARHEQIEARQRAERQKPGLFPVPDLPHDTGDSP